MASKWDPPFWIRDRLFTPADIELIRWTTDRFGGLSRTELASTICENLPWKAPNGQLRVHECLPLLEQLAAAGVVKLPAKQSRQAYRAPRLRAEPLPEVEIVASLRELQPVTVEPVPPQEQAVWDATMAAHHALGYQRAFGAHQRYWIRGQVAGEQVILGGLLFAAAAKSIAVRDAWVGWTPLQQQRFRYRIVANSRFLILPGVKAPHGASHALALAMRRLRGDWLRRFGYEPVLVETFMAPPWRGTCYRAANWVCLGQTTGRGRQDRQYAKAGVIRQVFVYSLLRDWRRALVAPISPPAQELRTRSWQGPNLEASKRRPPAGIGSTRRKRRDDYRRADAERNDRGAYPAAICSLGAFPGREAAPAPGRGRGAHLWRRGPGTGRRLGGHGQGNRPQGHAGTAKPDRDKTGTGAPQGRWPQTHDGFRSRSARPPGRTGVAEHPRGSGIAVALDVQEHTQTGHPAQRDEAWTRGQRSPRARPFARDGIQSSG